MAPAASASYRSDQGGVVLTYLCSEILPQVESLKAAAITPTAFAYRILQPGRA